MSNNTPIFPFLEAQQHFSDYGFDPQIDYFQVLEEARKHKKESAYSRSKGILESTTHFKLQKPIISKEDFSSKKIKKSKKRWWKNTIHFFKGKWPAGLISSSSSHHRREGSVVCHGDSGLQLNRSGGGFRGSMSGPVYITESRSGSSKPSYLTASRPSSGPLAGTLTPAGKSDLQIPYFSLREINMDQRRTASSAPTMPIYLVT